MSKRRQRRGGDQEEVKHTPVSNESTTITTYNDQINEPHSTCGSCDELERISQLNNQVKELLMSPVSSEQTLRSSLGNHHQMIEKRREAFGLFWGDKDRDVNPAGLSEVGNSTWMLLHTAAAYYPKTLPSCDDQRKMKSLINGVADGFPCEECANDFKLHISTDPPPLQQGRKSLEVWMCEQHNHVNEKLEKPRFDCSLAHFRWTGERD